ncbi:MAG: SulP family inorganic anion transporter [Verrucomicrobiota bacterium]
MKVSWQKWCFHLPLVQHLKSYNLKALRSDLKAGLNVSLLDFPQGMAYAMIAGLPVQFGIYASAIGSTIGPLFASSRYLMLGPTNASAVLLLSAFLVLDVSDEQRLVVLPLLIIMVSAFLFLGVFLQAHVILQYVSRSVVVGYITAAACLIIVNQLRHVLGIEVPRSGTFWEALILTGARLLEANQETIFLSLFTIGLYLLCKFFFKKLPAIAVALVLAGVVYYALNAKGLELQTLPPLPLASWPVSLPEIGFSLISQLASPAFAIAFLTLLESSSIAKTLAAKSGDRLDVKQQMFSMGAANFCNAFASGMPVSGSLTRSIVNFESGAKTPIASMISGGILVAGVLTLGPLIGYIPKAALATLVLVVGVSLFQYKTIKTVVLTTRSDMVTFLVTFLGGLFFPLDMAIYLGVGTSLILFIKKVSKPSIVEYAFDEQGALGERNKASSDRPAISIVHVEGDLFFGATDLFLEEMRRMVLVPHLKVMILRLRNARNLDASAALAIIELVHLAKEEGRSVLVSGVHKEVEQVFIQSGLMKLIGSENVFHYTPQNLTMSTRNALKRAQEIIGRDDADIILLTQRKDNKRSRVSKSDRESH